MSLKRNVVANYLGQGWKALTGLVFIPVYIHFLGIESFALVGIFGMLQAWLALLDMGMKPALAREMARFSAGRHGIEFIRDLLHSVVTVALLMAVVIGAAIWAASGWLASDWLQARQLSVAATASAISWMGLVVASRFIENIYVNCLVGLQRQVVQNAAGALLATVRNVGVIAVLAWVSPTIQAFFIWQGIVSLVAIATYSTLVHSILPRGPRKARFSWPALRHIWRFAGGMLAISLMAQLLTQLDKILLSRLLSLEAFGYYALAAMVATALRLIPGPITNAVYPRFTELVALDDGQPRLRALYHRSAQLVTVLMGSAALVLIVFPHLVLASWTGNAHLARDAAPLLSVLALGTLLNGLVWIPYQLQLAHGWTALAIRVNAVSVAFLVPAIFWLVGRFGAIGAAWAWVALNVGYMGFTIHFMHRRLLVDEKWRWYARDIALPLACAGAVAALLRSATPPDLGRLAGIAALGMYSCAILATAVFAAPLVRQQASRFFAAAAAAASSRLARGRHP
jgi:O-antigen/teichoic acid export membrane protein